MAAQVVDAGQIHQLGGAALQIQLRLQQLHREPRPVADLGMAAGELAEQGGFAGVGHAEHGDAGLVIRQGHGWAAMACADRLIHGWLGVWAGLGQKWAPAGELRHRDQGDPGAPGRRRQAGGPGVAMGRGGSAAGDPGAGHGSRRT